MPYHRFAVITLVMASCMSLAGHARADEGVCRDTSAPAACSCGELTSQISDLNRKLGIFESTRVITAERLRQKKAEQIKELAAAVRTQRQTIADFEGFVSWIASNLAGYNKYI